MAELKFYGANCFEIKTKDIVLLIDPLTKEYGKAVPVKDRVVVISDMTTEYDNIADARFVINSPGEYEISKVSIHGIAARRHIDEEDLGFQSIIYRITVEDVNIGVIANIDPGLTDDQLEALGVIDYLVLPVGGKGLTLDSTAAAKLVRDIEPKVVVPSHYANSKINYPVPQDDISVFTKEMAKDAKTEPKLKLSRASLPEDLEIVELEVN